MAIVYRLGSRLRGPPEELAAAGCIQRRRSQPNLVAATGTKAGARRFIFARVRTGFRDADERATMTSPRTVTCPTCSARVDWTQQSAWRPFCSERCKLIDFGAWANESFRIPAVERDEDESLPREPDQD